MVKNLPILQIGIPLENMKVINIMTQSLLLMKLLEILARPIQKLIIP